MADILKKIKIGVSPLSKRIQLYRMGKSPTDALESKDFTSEVYGAVIEHMMDGATEGGGMTTTVTSGDKAWDVTVMPVTDENTAQAKLKKEQIFLGMFVQSMISKGGTLIEPGELGLHGEEWRVTMTKVVK